jgi:hypothetical protein
MKEGRRIGANVALFFLNHNHVEMIGERKQISLADE